MSVPDERTSRPKSARGEKRLAEPCRRNPCLARYGLLVSLAAVNLTSSMAGARTDSSRPLPPPATEQTIIDQYRRRYNALSQDVRSKGATDQGREGRQSRQGIESSVCRAPELEPGVPHYYGVTHAHFVVASGNPFASNSHDAASGNPLRGRAFGVFLLRVKASLSEFDLGARRASRFKRMLRLAFRDAPNGEGREYLIAGSLQ